MRPRRSTLKAEARVQVPVSVEEAVGGEPVRVKLFRSWVDVEEWEKTGEIRGAVLPKKRVLKTHYRVTLRGGCHIVLLKNHLTGAWYRLSWQHRALEGLPQVADLCHHHVSAYLRVDGRSHSPTGGLEVCEEGAEVRGDVPEGPERYFFRDATYEIFGVFAFEYGLGQ